MLNPVVFSEPLVQNSRYKDGTTKNRSIVFSVVPYRALQSDRCLVVTSFTAVTRVQIPSGTPNLFKSLRGTATFGAGTKRHNSVANFWPGLPNRQCFRASGAVSCRHKKAHAIQSDQAARNRGCAKQANDPTLSSSLVDCNRLSVRIQCDSAGSMTQQLLHYLDICFSGRQQGRIRVPERVPSDVLCDSDLHCSGADKTPHDCLAPIRFFAGRSGTRKHPIIWFSVGCVLPPCLQR